MYRRHGIVLLDEREIVFRIYETSNTEWKLFHYHSALLPANHTVEASDLLEIIGGFFSTEYAQHIAEWKICSRHLSHEIIHDVSQALAINVEDLNLNREQELLCKGMFTELW